MMASLLSSKRLARAKNLFLLYLLWTRVVLASYRHVRARGMVGSAREVYALVQRFVVGWLLRLPSSRRQVESELNDLRSTLAAKLAPPYPHLRRDAVLPATGLTRSELSDELAKLALVGQKDGKEDWREGRVSGAVYHDAREVDEIAVEAYSMFSISNPLHPDVFPAVRKMEAEIVSMVLNMYGNPSGAGTTTSGGTESILLACKTYRDWARAVKGITRPEMIVPESAHAAFWKASDYFGIKLHPIPVDEKTRQVRVDLVRRAINPNTVMLVGSAPNFPDGIIDDIPQLAALALKHKTGMHVDGCLGSYLTPFLKKAGFPAPDFDFKVPGVTSISVDTHKYGMSCKGVSTLLWRDALFRSYQFYVLPGWKGGLYASPTLAGSRPGALLAGAWAVMVSRGESGYIDSCRRIMASAQRIKSAIQETSPVLSEHLRVLGDPVASVIAFSSKTPDIDMYIVGDRMSKRRWHLNALEGPPALHIACTTLTDAEALISDLEAVVLQLVAEKKAAFAFAPGAEGKAEEGQMVALYGLGASPVGSAMIPQVARAFLETLFVV